MEKKSRNKCTDLVIIGLRIYASWELVVRADDIRWSKTSLKELDGRTTALLKMYSDFWGEKIPKRNSAISGWLNTEKFCVKNDPTKRYF